MLTASHIRSVLRGLVPEPQIVVVPREDWVPLVKDMISTLEHPEFFSVTYSPICPDDKILILEDILGLGPIPPVSLA